MGDFLWYAVADVAGGILRELWRVFRTGVRRGKPHDGDILKLR